MEYLPDHDRSELFRLLNRMRAAWQNIAPCDTLSKAQFGTLAAIAKKTREQPHALPGAENAVTVSELARMLRQSLPATSQRVSVLETLGYAERVPVPGDRRAIGVRITPEGLRVMCEAHERFGGMLSRAIELLGRENLQTLLRLLSALDDALEQVAREPAAPSGPAAETRKGE